MLRPSKNVIRTHAGASIFMVVLIYAWEQSSDNKTWTRVLDTNHVGGKIGGLVTGQMYYFRYRTLLPGVGGAEPAYTGYSQVFETVAS